MRKRDIKEKQEVVAIMGLFDQAMGKVTAELPQVFHHVHLGCWNQLLFSVLQIGQTPDSLQFRAEAVDDLGMLYTYVTAHWDDKNEFDSYRKLETHQMIYLDEGEEHREYYDTHFSLS
jgi:hypothetical protein